MFKVRLTTCNRKSATHGYERDALTPTFHIFPTNPRPSEPFFSRAAERERFFSPAWPGYRHIAAASSAACRSVYGTSILQTGGLSILVQYILYIGLSCIQSLQPVVVQVCPYFTPLCHKADETALSRVPNLQKLTLPQACQVPHPGPVAFDVCCTIGAVCVFLHAFSRAEMTGISYDTSLLHTPWRDDKISRL